ncbi:MAG: RHS repeat-associated core domain-containing protein, partial [Lentisphaerae bacterium]|nr:RHS repeat-associated core domain-containing protein [Lentisphaerota bacterium]
LLYNATGELTKKGTKACVSDADGNLTDLEGGTMKCTYDAENRLTQYVRKVGTTTYTTKNTYNADGLRVKKAIDCGGGTTYYHYLPSGTLLFTTDLSGTIVDQHIYAGNMLLSTYNPSNTYDWGYYFCDRQGHVRFVADENGVSLAQYDYLPYGQYGANSDIKKFTYVGGLGVQDEGNGLFYMKNRFYDAGTGRFLQQDPIGFEGGSNLYAYADENPLRYVDPNGTASVGEWAWWGIVETAKVGVAAVAGTAAVVVGGVAVPVGIGIGAAVYVGEQAVHSMYQTGEKIKEMRKIAPSSSEASEEDQGNGNAAVAAQDKSGEQQEAIKKLGKSTEKETGSSGPTL